MSDPGPVAETVGGLGIYVHIPFCVLKCFYCDFASGPVSLAARRRYLQALQSEIENSPWRGARASTLFLGGGTPSELTVQELESLVAVLRRNFRFDHAAEWTLECNPGTVRPGKLRAIARCGFNRVSLGVQSWKDRYLEKLGRIHTASEALQSFHWVREAGFNNVNLDLIFALPGQSLQEWREDLDQTLLLSPEHLSLYNLTIEPGTQFGDWYAAGALHEVDEEVSAEMFEYAMDRTAEAGYGQYELSNYALPGRRCRHNQIYWRNENFLGVGVSAASFVDGERWSNTRSLDEYISTTRAGRTAHHSHERLESRAAVGEAMMLGLRTNAGVDLAMLARRYQVNLEQAFDRDFEFLLAENLIDRREDRVRLTRRGRLVANAVCSIFLEDPQRQAAG